MNDPRMHHNHHATGIHWTAGSKKKLNIIQANMISRSQLSFLILVAASTGCVAATKLIGATAHLVAPCTNKLITLDPKSAESTVLNSTFDGCPWHVNSAAFDRDKGMFYVLRRHGNNASPLFITKYSATSGSEISNTQLADASLRSLYSVFFDEDLQSLICIVLNQTTTHWTAVTIDPETGAITELLDLHTLSDIMGFDLAFSGYDPIEKKLYQVVETARSLVTLISVDVVNPNKSTSKPLNTGQSISDFLIAPVFHKGLLYGFMKNLTLTKFNLETGHVSAYGDQLMNVPPSESVLISSWHSVIDEEKGLLYISCTLNPEAKSPGSKSTFFSMDIDSGKVTLSKAISFPIMFLHLV